MGFFAGEGDGLGREGEGEARRLFSGGGAVGGRPQRPLADAHADEAGAGNGGAGDDIESGQAGCEHRRGRGEHAGGFAFLDDAPLPHDDHVGSEG